jgi:nitrogen fixation protein FixH
MISNRSAPREEFRFTGWHMLAILVSFFAVVIAVNLTMAYFARASWPGLVVPNSYVASQSFDRDLRIARQQHALGWRSMAELARDRLRVTMTDGKGEPLTGLHLTVRLQRPATEAEDLQLVLGEVGDGRYEAAVAIAAGLWTADITAERQRGPAVRFIERLTVR